MFFGFLVATPEQYKIEILREQIFQDTDQEIETFLGLNAGNHCQERPINMGRIQIVLL